ncbi:uncharacterized protein LOC130689040 isoform X2 [Daphnia carinata]|uniref:uncharacterized protein LOC130689040 isoform X1 n=1 Tax=Daphnia carinata TaxID=120202 RepID=UPI00257E692E|nr:uncharacterized protein LOC130689040 isoform X1 [Daphnia carinata]XP_057368043.1 uncharacterized protein LOC130689040 isoform X2 [Daphnia carinata]
MDFKWSYDQQEPSVFIPYMFDTPNSYMATVLTADFGYSLDLNTDSVQCYLENESNEEIDIETITPISHFDMDAKQTVEQYQEILTNGLIHSNVQDLEGTEIRMKKTDEYARAVDTQQNSMNIDSIPASRESREWQYIQYTDTFGSTQCFAVNNEAHDQKEQVEESQTHHQLLTLQPDCSKSQLYRLLNLSSDTNHSTDEPLNFETVTELTYQSDSGKTNAQSYPPSGNVSSTDQLIVMADLTVLVKKITEQDHSIGLPEVTKKDEKSTFFPKPAQSKTKVAHYPITGDLGLETGKLPDSPRPAEEIFFDAVGPSPSNPESALYPIPANSEIGPFCTAIGIFSSVFYMTALPHNRSKLQAEELKNGVIIELHNRWLQNKDTRKNFVRVLCLLFDIGLDWTNPCVVIRLFRKALIPLLAERADLVRCFTATSTRRASHSKWKTQKDSNPHQQISQFDSAVFVIPPDRFEDTFPNPIKAKSKVINSNLADSKPVTGKGRKPTQGQQLLDLQARFDAFRREQRKHNTAFLRHISLIQRQLEDMKRNTSKRLFQNRRRSMLNPTV